MIHKVQAFIYRNKNNQSELLIFEHDITKIHQLIRGTVEEGEDFEKAVLREIKEESGLSNIVLKKKLGEIILEIKGGPTRSGPLENQSHHAYLLEVKDETPDKWTHLAQGSKEEDGLKFHFYWAQTNKQLTNIVFDDFKPFIPTFLTEMSNL